MKRKSLKKKKVKKVSNRIQKKKKKKSFNKKKVKKGPNSPQKKKKKYKVTNWKEYNEALISRGDVTLWIDEALLAQWISAFKKKKKGRPFFLQR